MLQWTWARFQALGVDALYDALALRARVFILEQGPYLDLDGIDAQAWHLLGRGAPGDLLAYLRVVDPGVKFEQPSIGRVVVDKAQRGTGLGRGLMQEGILRCESVWPGRPIRISAQLRLQAFYASLGFVAQGEPYLEDTIPHLHMERPGASSDSA